MSTSNVIIGAKYEHDETGAIMMLDSGSAPECDNWVTLSAPNDFCREGFASIWRGTWDDF